MVEPKESWYDRFLTYGLLLIFAPAFVSIVDGVVTLGTQIVVWLRSGEWVPQTLWEGLHKFVLTDRPSLAWVIPDRLLNWALELPRSGGMMAVGIIYLVIVSLFLIIFLSAVEKIMLIWSKRHDEPFIVWPTFTLREKICTLATIVWLVGFPFAAAFAVPDTDKSKIWSDMVGVGAVMAFWFWVIFFGSRDGFRKRKTKETE